MVFPVDVIFVPQGAEYNAVCKGLANCKTPPEIIAIPMGINSVTNFLRNKQFNDKRILLMGLAGSLSSQYKVGDVVIYENCSYIENKSQLMTKFCHAQLTQLWQKKLNINLVKGLTINHIVYSAKEKQELAENYHLDVVDMEGFACLNHSHSVTIIRVISDNYNDDLPNLNLALNKEGQLDTFKMFLEFLRKPKEAINLIRNSLKALKILEKFTTISIS